MALLQVFSHLCLIIIGLRVLSGAKQSASDTLLGFEALDTGSLEAQGPMVLGASRVGEGRVPKVLDSGEPVRRVWVGESQDGARPGKPGWNKQFCAST